MLKLKIYLNAQNLSREFGNFETFFKFSQLFSGKPEREQSTFKGLKNQDKNMTRTVFTGISRSAEKWREN
jgi:hypothetical protein